MSPKIAPKLPMGPTQGEQDTRDEEMKKKGVLWVYRV
jgi:hypothetical protein